MQPRLKCSLGSLSNHTLSWIYLLTTFNQFFCCARYILLSIPSIQIHGLNLHQNFDQKDIVKDLTLDFTISIFQSLNICYIFVLQFRNDTRLTVELLDTETEPVEETIKNKRYSEYMTEYLASNECIPEDMKDILNKKPVFLPR